MLKGSQFNEQLMRKQRRELARSSAVVRVFRAMQHILLFIAVVVLVYSNNPSTAFSPSPSRAVLLLPRGPTQQQHGDPHGGRGGTTAGGGTGGRSTTTTTTTRLYGLLGRFRRKKTVEQIQPIGVGDLLPDGDVEVLKHNGAVEEGAAVDYATESISNLLGKGKTLLVGMPGAFTPTCSTQHLPGYVKNAGKLAEVGGITTIAVLTTNDRFVNEEWGSQQGALGAASDLMMLSDGDGDFVKALGLADDMGFGIGVRSKRFALLLQDGKVENLVVDEGLNDCSCTSAEAILKLVTPPAALQEENDDGGMGVGIGAVAVAAAALAFFAATGIGGGGNIPSSSPPPAATRVEKVITSQTRQPQEPPSSGFTLLDQFKQ